MGHYQYLLKYDDLFTYVLAYLNEHGVQPWRALERPTAEPFQLSDEDLAIEYPSGNAPTSM